MTQGWFDAHLSPGKVIKAVTCPNCGASVPLADHRCEGNGYNGECGACGRVVSIRPRPATNGAKAGI